MPRVALRRYALADAPLLHEAGLESWREVQPRMGWCHPDYALAEAEQWGAQQAANFDAGSEFDFTIRDEAGAFLGGCGLNHIEPENGRLGGMLHDAALFSITRDDVPVRRAISASA